MKPNYALARLATFAIMWLAMALSSVCAQPADPFGGTSDVDPNPQDAIRPFDDEDPKIVAAREAEERRLRAENAIGRAVLELTLRRRFNTDDSSQLQGTLSLLHYYESQKDNTAEHVVDAFAELAQHPWQDPQRDESPADFVKRLLATPSIDEELIHFDCGFGFNWREQFEAASDQPWPFDWRRREAHWKSVAESFFASYRAADPAEVWKQRIKQDGAREQFYAAAYLGTIRGRELDTADASLIALYVRGAQGETERLTRLAQALVSVSAAQINAEDRLRVFLRERLLKAVSSATEQAVVDNATALASVYDNCDSTLESEPLIRLLLDRDSPLAFARFSRAAKMPAATEFRWYLRKPTMLSHERIRAHHAVLLLQQRVWIPLWVDDSVASDETTIAVRATGSWLEVLQAVADAAKLELVVLEEGLLWLGPREKLPAAQAMLAHSRAKIPSDRKSYVAQALTDETETDDWVDTSVSDYCDYLQDLHAVQFLCQWNGWVGPGDAAKDIPRLTLDLRRMPLHLALSILAKKGGLDWAAGEDVVVVGAPKYVASFNDAALTHRRRMLTLSLCNDWISERLAEPTTLEFIETPLIDVAAYLSDLHGITVVCVPGIDPELGITANLKGISLAWAVTLMTFDHQIDWHAGNDAIYLGKAADLERLLAMEETRSQRRTAYPPKLREQLQQLAKPQGSAPTVRRFIDDINAASGLAIVVDESNGGIGSLPSRGVDDKLPVDVHLDLLTLDDKLQWRIEGDSITVRAKAMQNE